MALVGTWPQITTIGTESAMQSRTGVTVFVARRHEAGTLFIGGYDQGHRRLAVGRAMLVVIAKHRVVGRQYRAAGIAEHGVDVFVSEYLDDDIGAAHRGAGKRVIFRGSGELGRGHGGSEKSSVSIGF